MMFLGEESQDFYAETDEDLSRKIQWLMFLRVGTVTLVLGIAAIVQASVEVSYFELPLVYLYSLIALTYFLTFPYALILGRTRHMRRFAMVQFICDVLLINAILYVTGGIGSIFPFLYLLVIFGASILLSRRGMLTITLLCCFGYGGLVLLELSGLIHPTYSQISNPPLFDPAYVYYRTFFHIAAFVFVSILSYSLVAKMRRAAEELLKKQRALEGLQALNINIVQSINSGLITVDREMQITSFNKAAESITGYRDAEVLSRSISEVFPEIALYLGAPANRAIDRIFSRWEAIFEKRSGRDLHLGFSASHLRDRSGKREGQVIIFQDLTRFKELEEDLKRADRLAAVGELAAGMAHEIRNPLASLSGSIEVLKGELALDSENQRLMDIVLRESERLNDLVTNFLLFAKPGSPLCERIEPAEVIRETLELLRRHSAFVSSITISEELEDSVSLFANSQQMKQVLQRAGDWLDRKMEFPAPRQGLGIVLREEVGRDAEGGTLAGDEDAGRDGEFHHVANASPLQRPRVAPFVRSIFLDMPEVDLIVLNINPHADTVVGIGSPGCIDFERQEAIGQSRIFELNRQVRVVAIRGSGHG